MMAKETDSLASFKAFVRRNKNPIFQMLAIAALIIAGVAMLELSSASYTPPQYKPVNNSNQISWANFTSQPGGLQDSQQMNCTPLLNTTRKLSYSYKVSSRTPEGIITMYFSYNYAGEEILNGQRTDIVEIRANATFQNVTFNPVSRLWLDYYTGKCLKGEMDMGSGSVYPINCADANFGVPVVTCQEQLVGLKRTEYQTVSVPAGTFDATRYDKGKESLWLADNIPVPVKFTFIQLGDTAVAELTSYSEKT